GKLPLFLMCAFPYFLKEELLPKFLKSDFNFHYYRRILGATYFNREEWDKCLELIKLREKRRPGYLLELGKEFEKQIKRIIEFCRRYRGSDFSRSKARELEIIYKKFIDLKKKWLALDMTYYVIDRYLPGILTSEVGRKLKDKSKFNEIIEILTGLDRPTLVREEKFQLLKIADLVNKRKFSLKSGQVQRMMKNHIKKYGFLNHYFYYYEPYSAAEMGKRIKEILAKNLKEEIRKMKLQEKNQELTEKIVKELKLSPQAKLIIGTLKEWGFCLNYLDEAGCLITHYFKNFLLELARRMGVTYEMLIEMTFEEIDEFFRKGAIPPAKKIRLKERIKSWGLVYQKGKFKVYSGKELERLEQQEKQKVGSQIKRINLIKGIIASSGKVRGIVRVVESHRDIAKIKKGEILVAPKTTPKYVPAMEKAVAIITDEGGLLSHAAIVSRELGIPCVVGTKIATRALKDGDLVEIDANKGVVRKI
ncbi:MAG: PEP-utilizing enzyme, partial [Patescibacteria group bacterium]|nr:PEP-utilizing enzyme [Patescibacteria group bacterium]